ncbi:asparaginase [Nocardioides sp. Root122]|uniref:asparaginase n=1 Tax=Nocardioides TaxID=1839 RepID=UPI0007033A04|nr:MULTISPECIES: asparaginase [Nocardioides]KQV77730.1 asparaginase [Nocardioides sp. Root122]MCK9822196.1 asparaginase [Nocardioides cavernae]
MSAGLSAGLPVVAEIVRSGFVEGHHYGSIVALAAGGSVDWSVGEVDVPVLPRSSNKPIQALAMVELGLDLPPELVALACASHSGEPFHVDGVRRILASAGLDESALQTPADYPLDDDAREAVVRDGGSRSPILMNCSGKHAAMLATCVLQGWDTATYLAPDHPLQQAISATFARLTGEPVTTVAVDGCGAPLLSTSLVGLARAFAALATATEGPEQRVAEAIRQHPQYVSGTTRDELRLHRAIPGLIGKAGAESCYAIALPDGRAWALKTDDGAARVRPVLMAEALRRSGVLDEPGVDGEAVAETGRHELLGGGKPVGEIRAAF